MEKLKRCPFCGAEPPTVKVLHPLNVDMASWVVCGKCGVSTSATFGKEKAVEASSKHGTNATKRIKYGAGTQAENINDSSVGTRSCDGRADRRGIWSIHPQLRTVC